MGTSVSLFVVIATVIALLTMALVLRPLWRERPAPAIAAVAMLAMLTLGLYRLVGTPAALDPAMRQVPATLPDAIAQLETELQRNPRQVEGWRLLGRAYADGQQPAKARDAYAQAAQLAPDDPDVLVEAAEARALASPQRRFDVQAVAQLQQALRVQAQHQRARWFLGIAQRQAGKPADAANTWEPLLAQVDAKTAAPLRAQIDAARGEAGLPPLPAAAPVTANPTLLEVQVKLDPELAARMRLRGGASVFVIARAPGGPPMPLAVERHGVQEVEVIARLSVDGNAIPQAGDLESRALRVKLPSSGPLVLTIDHARP